MNSSVSLKSKNLLMKQFQLPLIIYSTTNKPIKRVFMFRDTINNYLIFIKTLILIETTSEQTASKFSIHENTTFINM